MKKISIIMGRGIEGCGVTKFTIEQSKWLEENDYDYKIFASKDKTWTRTKSHDTSNVHLLKFSSKDEVNEMVAQCNDSDLVIINSLPAKSFKEDAIYNFAKAIGKINTPIALIQHDHSMLSIRRNAALDEAIDSASIIFTHSTENDFASYARNRVGGGITLFGEEEGTPIVGFQPGIFFDEIREKYLKPIEEIDFNHHKWIGRTTPWKGYKELFELHQNYLQPARQLTTYEGIEKSPAFILFREQCNEKYTPNYHFEKEDYLIENYDLSNAYGESAHIFGPYKQDEMLERMSRVGFGYQLSLLKPHFIQRSIEYTHCEVASIGTIPVFRKKYGELCKHRHYEKPLIECENNGTIWFDEDNLNETFDMILKLQLRRDLFEEYRNNAFEFYKLHQDANYTFSEMMERINEAI